VVVEVSKWIRRRGAPPPAVDAQRAVSPVRAVVAEKR
jgi:hypothetical protein